MKTAILYFAGSSKVSVHVDADELGYTVFEPMQAGADNHPRLVESGDYRLLACLSECNCPLNVTIAVIR